MTGQELPRLERIWGAENLVRSDASVVDPLGLPADARRILVEVGLPRVQDPIFEPERPRLIEVPSRPGIFCRIGNDFGTAICVEPSTGAILSLSPSGAYPDCFVNSSLPLFVEFLTAFELTRRDFVRETDEESARRVAQLREQFRERDPRADETDTFWSSYLWDLERQME